MRVLMFAEVLHPDTVGGAGRVAAELGKALAHAGVEMRIVTRVTTRAPARDETRDGIRIFRHDVDLSSPAAAWRTTRRGVSEAVEQALEDFRPDIIHFHQPHTAYHAMPIPALSGIPSVYCFHSSWADELRNRGGLYAFLAPFAARIENDVFLRFSRIIVLSEYSRRVIENIRPKAPTVIIPGGVDTEMFPLKAGDQKNDQPVLFTVRNLVRRMGLDSLVEAARILKGRGRRFKLEIGGTGPLEKELRSSARDLGEACEFLGHIPESKLTFHYRRADLFVLPTAAIEGFGLVILEAFASGTPVIGTPVGAIAELVGLQGDGYVTATPEPEEIAHSIELFLDRPDRPDPRFLRRIAEEHTWSIMGKRTMELYRSIAGS